MPWTVLNRWIGAALCILLSGCTPCDLVCRTMRWEPSSFWWKTDRERSRDTYRIWANQAWEQEGQGCAGAAAGKDYEAGFKDGFVDYVFAGGTGEPPPVPPRTFWNMDLRLPEGRERANQWFAGYRQGARVARDSGYRNLAEIQTSLSGPSANDAYSPPRDGAFDRSNMEGPSWSQPEELPGPMLNSIVPTVPANGGPPNGVAEPVPANSTSPPAPTNQSPGMQPPTGPVPPGQPVEELERTLKSTRAPEEIQLPSLDQRTPAPGRPATVPYQSPRQPGDSANRLQPVRLTSNPEFEW
jgi:hypothetical protein